MHSVLSAVLNRNLVVDWG